MIEFSKIHSIEETNHLKDIIQVQFGIARLKTVKGFNIKWKISTIDTPSLIIPYYDYNNNLIGLQTRYLGKVQPDFNIPRFKRICGSSIRLYNLLFWNRYSLVQDFLLLRA